LESKWRRNILDRSLGWGYEQWTARVLSGFWEGFYILKYYGTINTGDLGYWLTLEDFPDQWVSVLGPFSSPWPYGFEVESDRI
jgi:hypothetical protein